MNFPNNLADLANSSAVFSMCTIFETNSLSSLLEKNVKRKSILYKDLENTLKQSNKILPFVAGQVIFTDDMI